jgi:tetratricopeptide (TPR) repeat protein
MNDEFSAHYERAWSQLRAFLVAPRPLTADQHAAALEARADFQRCLALVPDSWASMWGLGKVEQAMGEHDVALGWFEEASRTEARNSDIWREASLEAMAIGDRERALIYAQRAVDLSPNNAGLRSNLALALLLQGLDAEAHSAAASACRQHPGDLVSREVLELVEGVRAGNRPRPTHIGNR